MPYGKEKNRKDVTKQAKNDNLHKAKTVKNDEFYTTKSTVEAELGHYWDHFKGKIVYCNCDDPYESEFFKYFMIRFNLLGLKGLFATCYEGSKMAQYQLQVFDDEDYKGIPYKIEIYQEDVDELLEEYGFLSQDTIKSYIKTHKKAERLKGNGSFDSPECIELLEESDIVVTNEPFSLTIPFINLLMTYNKKFLIIANKNAITYKEVFPLIKENKMWLGYTQPKDFITPTGELSKKLSGLTRWFTNLDIPKRHEDLIIWKKYSPEEYPHYDNYDAINVDKVAEIPCDYCESWGLYPEEYEALDKAQWEEVRRESKEDTELIYVIPAKGTKLRQALHEHSEGYKEEIEKELTNSIYCNGEIGVPITVVDKLNDEQFKIVGADFDLALPVELDNGKTGTGRFYVQKGLDNHTAIGNNPSKEPRSQGAKEQTSLQSNCHPQGTVTESSECQLHSLTNKTQNSSVSSTESEDTHVLKTNLRIKMEHMEQTSMENTNILEYISKRYCNGIMGVPITFMDKLNPEQFEIVGLAPERLSPNESNLQIKRYVNAIQHKKDGTICNGNKVNDGPVILHNSVPSKFPYYTSEIISGKYLEVLYARVLIRKIVEV